MKIIEGTTYCVKDILPILFEKASRAIAKDEKIRMVNALEPFSEKSAIWQRSGRGWGSSVLNLRNWLNPETGKPFLMEEEIRQLSNKFKKPS